MMNYFAVFGFIVTFAADKRKRTNMIQSGNILSIIILRLQNVGGSDKVRH